MAKRYQPAAKLVLQICDVGHWAIPDNKDIQHVHPHGRYVSVAILNEVLRGSKLVFNEALRVQSNF